MDGCGDTCGDGCGCEGGDSYGGYDGVSEGSYDSGDEGYPAGAGEGTESNPNVIYDGPAEGAPPIPKAPEPIPAPTAKVAPRATNQLASYSRKRSAEFERGLRLYRDGNLKEAMSQFEAAAETEPKNALYHYHHALVMYDLYGPEAADELLQNAIAAEQRQAVANWGRQMERIQGPARIWIEKARRNAGLVK
jgi:tetratricopeptide (TPR) repeat protein